MKVPVCVSCLYLYSIIYPSSLPGAQPFEPETTPGVSPQPTWEPPQTPPFSLLHEERYVSEVNFQYYISEPPFSPESPCPLERVHAEP